MALCVRAQLLQLCPTLCKPSLPGSSVHGILQARILEWVTMPSSRGSSWPRNQTCVTYVSCIAGRFFITESLSKPQIWSYWTPKLGISDSALFPECTFLPTACVSFQPTLVTQPIMPQSGTFLFSVGRSSENQSYQCQWSVHTLHSQLTQRDNLSATNLQAILCKSGSGPSKLQEKLINPFFEPFHYTPVGDICLFKNTLDDYTVL